MSREGKWVRRGEKRKRHTYCCTRTKLLGDGGERERKERSFSEIQRRQKKEREKERERPPLLKARRTGFSCSLHVGATLVKSGTLTGTRQHHQPPPLICDCEINCMYIWMQSQCTQWMQHVILLHNKEAAFCGVTAACVCVCVCTIK